MSQLPPHLERAEFFRSLIRDGFSISQIAKKYNKSLAYVSNTLRLLRLPELVKEGLVNGDISEGHARALLAVKSKEQSVLIYKEIVTRKISVRKTEKLVQLAGKAF